MGAAAQPQLHSHSCGPLLENAAHANRTPNTAKERVKQGKAQQLTFLRACWNMSRTRLAPTPVNISMNSVPAAQEKNRRRLDASEIGQPA